MSLAHQFVTVGLSILQPTHKVASGAVMEEQIMIIVIFCS
eukprot:SAG11_NODE_206_length_12389_cov_11.831192_8_plen_40_part_00